MKARKRSAAGRVAQGPVDEIPIAIAPSDPGAGEAPRRHRRPSARIRSVEPPPPMSSEIRWGLITEGHAREHSQIIFSRALPDPLTRIPPPRPWRSCTICRTRGRGRLGARRLVRGENLLGAMAVGQLA